LQPLPRIADDEVKLLLQHRRTVYEKLSLIGNEELPGYAHVRGKEALAEIDDRLLDGTLNKKLYKKESSPEAWHYMDDLLTGKRKSYRTELNPI
jgi:hypothetical protein